ncbi:hypothetical protein KEM60_01755 [Austwickia sp. TVS 96-490-7B]|nr:hypothetical protein [Austwickia sp. TVS 96-490-7B]
MDSNDAASLFAELDALSSQKHRPTKTVMMLGIMSVLAGALLLTAAYLARSGLPLLICGILQTAWIAFYSRTSNGPNIRGIPTYLSSMSASLLAFIWWGPLQTAPALPYFCFASPCVILFAAMLITIWRR